MTISTRTLGRAYTHPDELPSLLEKFENNILVVYDDMAARSASGPGHYPTIGIGFNIAGNENALRLMLAYLGVFGADDTSQEAALAQAGKPPRTSAQVSARHSAIVSQFGLVISSHPLSRASVNIREGTSASERALQAALKAKMAQFGVNRDFAFARPGDARAEKIR